MGELVMISRRACYAGVSLLFCMQPVLAGLDRECPRIVSDIERLACFDRAAGTPAHVSSRSWSAQEQEAPTVMRVMANEASRAADDLTFRIGSGSEAGSATAGLMISAPAIASTSEGPYLAISCIQKISRLQLITTRPVDASWVTVRLTSEGGATRNTPWRVMENGQVLDGGRGLPAIEQIRQLIGAHRIVVASDRSEVDGLVFDAQGLGPLIEQARGACRW
ncbi:type VI secretion system-associated protein VasI [Pseudomonas sp. UBA4617]|uniref:type VI secretion system-associated protein VasI n=1 Tax=Pseudomonas sp. UBA4617 TaxID=1947318 RepID=UPI0025F10AEB|nr:type VI secretion system-associated protein VasI [Pseudomonas sp. UBA4617]